MSSNTSKKAGYSKKILRLLGSKPAISAAELTEMTGAKGAERYALSRSLRGLVESGLVESHDSGQQTYTRLTREGKKKAHSLALEHEYGLLNPHWDGKWRIVLLDLPEDRKAERESFRYLLKKAGFVCIKNAVWVSPQPFEHLFANIKKDLGLSTEIMIFVTDTLDSETEQEFLRLAL